MYLHLQLHKMYINKIMQHSLTWSWTNCFTDTWIYEVTSYDHNDNNPETGKKRCEGIDRFSFPTTYPNFDIQHLNVWRTIIKSV